MSDEILIDPVTGPPVWGGPGLRCPPRAPAAVGGPVPAPWHPKGGRHAPYGRRRREVVVSSLQEEAVIPGPARCLAFRQDALPGAPDRGMQFVTPTMSVPGAPRAGRDARGLQRVPPLPGGIAAATPARVWCSSMDTRSSKGGS